MAESAAPLDESPDELRLARRTLLHATWMAVATLPLAGCGGGGGGGSPAPVPTPPAPPAGNTPPLIAGFTPGAGAPGTDVTIEGLNFAPTAAGNSVTFNGTPAHVQSANATQIVARVPAGAGSGPLRVTTAGGSAQSSASFSVLAASAFTTRVLGPRVEGGLAWNGSLLVSVGSAISTSTDAAPQVWNERAALANLDDVAWDGKLFVAVGFAGMRTSPDGLTWTGRSLPATRGDLNAAAGNGTVWVAVGDDGSLLSSPDGITWTLRTAATGSHLHRVVWAGSFFVAVGASGTVLTSPDGVAWTVRSAGVTDDFTGLGSDGVLVVAATAASNNSPSRILTSPDGINWTPRASGLGHFQGFARAPGGGRWVAVGAYCTAHSSDGLSWTRVDLPMGWPRRVVHTGNRFVALGANGAGQASVWTSDDGQAWALRVTSMGWRALARSPQGRIVAVPQSDRSAASTDGGSTWTFGTSVSDAGINLFLDAVWSEALGRFAAVVQVAANQYLYTSTDGLVWTPGSHVPFNGRLGASPTLLVAVGGSLTGFGLATSPDGVTWTPRTLPVSTRLNDVFWLGARFVAAGAGGVLLTSDDGTTWTQRASGTTQALQAVAASPTRWVAVGDGGTVLTSDDAGLTWTPRSSGTNYGLAAVVWTGSAFVATGGSGLLLRSSDGVSWTRQDTPWQTVPFGSDALNLDAALWLGDRLLLAGSRGLFATALV
jgi:hypothetical protein